MGGQWTGPVEKLNRLTGNIYTAERRFAVDGVKHLIMATAVCYDKQNVRMSAAIMSLTPGVRKHDAETMRLQASIIKLEREAVRKDGRPTSIEQAPPRVKGLRQGGMIKPGRYVGVGKAKRDNKAGQRYDLVIFDNGEYEILGRKRNNTGRFTYSTATGRLQIDEPFRNDTYDWDEEFCVFGKNGKGEYVIHAETNYWLTVIKWVGESDRTAPSEIARQTAIAKAEAARYKHVTKVGEGISEAEIEAVIYCFDTKFRSGATQVDYEGYLVMKDGRVLDGLPCSPDTMDLPASRSRAPDSWGWWKKVEGDQKSRYTFAWPVRDREYRMPKGVQVKGFPFEKGTRLSGDFGSASTEVAIGIYSSVRWWGIKFNKNGRFMKYRNGSTQSQMVDQDLPGGTGLITTVWDDEGAVTAVSTPYVAGGTKSKNSNPAAGRMGTYEIDRYRLTLKYDNGRVEHHATFTNKDKNSIWFEGHSLGLKKSKKPKN